GLPLRVFDRPPAPAHPPPVCPFARALWPRRSVLFGVRRPVTRPSRQPRTLQETGLAAGSRPHYENEQRRFWDPSRERDCIPLRHPPLYLVVGRRRPSPDGHRRYREWIPALSCKRTPPDRTLPTRYE